MNRCVPSDAVSMEDNPNIFNAYPILPATVIENESETSANDSEINISSPDPNAQIATKRTNQVHPHQRDKTSPPSSKQNSRLKPEYNNNNKSGETKYDGAQVTSYKQIQKPIVRQPRRRDTMHAQGTWQLPAAKITRAKRVTDQMNEITDRFRYKNSRYNLRNR